MSKRKKQVRLTVHFTDVGHSHDYGMYLENFKLVHDMPRDVVLFDDDGKEFEPNIKDPKHFISIEGDCVKEGWILKGE